MRISSLFFVLGTCVSFSASAVPITAPDFYTPDSTTYSVGETEGLLANDSSSDGGLRVVSYSAPDQGSLSLTTNGSFTYSPDSGQSTNTVITYTATDDSNTFSSSTITFDLESTLPQAIDDFYTPDSTTFSVDAADGWLVNDVGGIGDLTTVSFLAPSQGALSAAADGSFTYSPDFGQATNETVVYSMRDDLGRFSSAEVTFDLESTLPQAMGDFYTPDSTTFSVDAADGWLVNDAGGIGDLTTVSFLAPSQGTLSAAADGSFTYSPDFGQATNETVVYSMRDDLGRFSSAEVTFDLESTLPQAFDDFYTVQFGEDLFVDLDGLLWNDILGVGSLSVQSFTASSDGLLSVFSDGAFNFSPDEGFFGLTTFNYTMSDALGRISSATAAIDVIGPIRVPEPASFWLFMTGLLVAARSRVRRIRLSAND